MWTFTSEIYLQRSPVGPDFVQFRNNGKTLDKRFFQLILRKRNSFAEEKLENLQLFTLSIDGLGRDLVEMFKMLRYFLGLEMEKHFPPAGGQITRYSRFKEKDK